MAQDLEMEIWAQRHAAWPANSVQMPVPCRAEPPPEAGHVVDSRPRRGSKAGGQFPMGLSNGFASVENLGEQRLGRSAKNYSKGGPYKTGNTGSPDSFRLRRALSDFHGSKEETAITD